MILKASVNLAIAGVVNISNNYKEYLVYVTHRIAKMLMSIYYMVNMSFFRSIYRNAKYCDYSDIYFFKSYK